MSAPAPGVLVTGAARGIGRACVAELAGRGLHVLAGVRTPEDADAVRSERVTPLLLDVTDEAGVRAAAVEAAAVLRGTTLLGVVNNAGTMVSGPLEHVPLDAVRRQLEVNLLGPLAVAQAFLPMLRASGGRVVMVGSTSGRLAGRFVGPYAASKAGLERLAATLRLELAGSGVTVSVVEPGAVATSLWDREVAAQDAWTAALPPEGREHHGAAAAHRRGRLAGLGAAALDPAEVAAAVAEALLSTAPRPRYVVGRRARLLVAMERTLPERVRIRLGR